MKPLELPCIDDLRQVFSYDPESGALIRLKGPRQGQPAGHISSDGYLRVWVNGKQYAFHRVVWTLVTGEAPKFEIDHINGVRSDNRFSNLREATPAQNQANHGRRVDNSSGVSGVHWSKRDGKWEARIRVNGKRLYLGQFSEKAAAGEAYARAAKQHRGEFFRA